MSAAPVEHAETSSKLRLIPLIGSKGRIPDKSFLIFIICLLGLGVALIYGLATTVQNESAKLAELKVQANELRYREAALQSQVEEQASGQYLSARAWELGMRPNPYPAVLNVEDGSVVGVQQPVAGNEVPLAEPPALPVHTMPKPEGEPAAAEKVDEAKEQEKTDEKTDDGEEAPRGDSA